MSVHYKNPPLIELIAEFRWDPDEVNPPIHSQQAGPIQFQLVDPSVQEAFYSRFGDACHALGFTYTERLLPPGMAAQLGQPMYRYRSDTDSVIAQVGNGIATVNALPPYNSWDGFAPKVSELVSVLLETRGSATPFESVSVRYLNAFGSRFLQGKTPFEYGRDVLGFSFAYPSAVKSLLDPASPTQFAGSFAFATKDGLQVQLQVSEGFVNNEPAFILDMTARSGNGINPDRDAVMDVLNRAHLVIHKIFVDATESQREILEPVGKE
ncbi:TIGR04255 family protein [Streptomyces sp. L7]|uniref:TIGR04255 family protein n=1 Tax=Streptomyces sp. L7 TaxID=3423954 RepID=UPI003D95F622